MECLSWKPGGNPGALQADPRTARRAVKAELSFSAGFLTPLVLLGLPRSVSLFKCMGSSTSFGLRLEFKSKLDSQEDKNCTYTFQNI